jgi:hypothetical protein
VAKTQSRARNERFEANHLKGLKMHGHFSSLLGAKLWFLLERIARKNTTYCGCYRLISQPIEVV